MKTIIILSISVLTIMSFIPTAYADIIHNNAGTINNLVIGDNATYFFGVDRAKQTPTWEPDTNIYLHDDTGIRLLTESHFIFPMELTEYGNYLYFSKLSDSCIDSMVCDYQDLVKISKIDGSFDIIAEHLKSAIQISVEDNGVYVSESSGKIWKFSHDGADSKILYETKDVIIMDLMTENDGTVYWIEEIEDQNNIILKMKPGSQPAVIASNLAIPYDLKDDYGQFWNEIYMDVSKGVIAEHTRITEHRDTANMIVGNFKNTSPISQSGKHYGPYLIVGDYLLFANNTGSNSKIQMKNTMTEKMYDVTTTDYDIRFMKAAENSLYIVGSNQDGFLIEKITLPVSVPEFSVFTVTILSTIMILAVLCFRKFPILNQLH